MRRDNPLLQTDHRGPLSGIHSFCSLITFQKKFGKAMALKWLYTTVIRRLRRVTINYELGYCLCSYEPMRCHIIACLFLVIASYRTLA